MRRTLSGCRMSMVGCLLVVAVLALGLVGPRDADAAKCQLPATGQTTCWDSSGNVIPCAGTGQDGDIQAGKTLRYKDNGNGTITDKITGLIWEKKSDDDSIHDMNTFYTWTEAFEIHVATLNDMNFAKRHDWRLPNAKELQTIVDYENTDPAVDPAFNNGCIPGATVLTGSCTPAFGYWSSSTYGFNPTSAWLVFFYDGFAYASDKDNGAIVRAVRGGCVN